RATRGAPRDDARRRDTAARRSARVEHTVPRRTPRNAVMRLGALPSWRPPRLAGDRRRGKVSRVMRCRGLREARRLTFGDEAAMAGPPVRQIAAGLLPVD